MTPKELARFFNKLAENEENYIQYKNDGCWVKTCSTPDLYSDKDNWRVKEFKEPITRWGWTLGGEYYCSANTVKEQ